MRSWFSPLLAVSLLGLCLPSASAIAEDKEKKPPFSPRQELVANELMRQMEEITSEFEAAKTVETARVAARRITQIARGPLATAVNHARTLGVLQPESALALGELMLERGTKMQERLQKAFFALLEADTEVRDIIMPAWLEVNEVLDNLPEAPEEDVDGEDEDGPGDLPVPPMPPAPPQAE